MGVTNNLGVALRMGAGRWAPATRAFAHAICRHFAHDMTIGWWVQLLDDYDRRHRAERPVRRSHQRMRRPGAPVRRKTLPLWSSLDD